MKTMRSALSWPFHAMETAVGRNAAVCVLAELALSGLRHMYMPYVTPYMLAIGLTEVEIGLISSVNLGVQMVLCLLGGFLSDKFGRRKTVTVLDYICWATPLFIWAIARNFYYFLVAAIFNAFFRASYTAFSCLLIEDVPQEKRALPYAFFQIVSISAGFMAPLGVLLIGTIGLVPAMRLMYAFCGLTCCLTTFIRYRFCRETQTGLRRMEEMRHATLGRVFTGYGRMVGTFFRSPSLILVVLIYACTNICMTLRVTWMAPLITKALGFTDAWVGYASTFGSISMLLSLLIFMPRIMPHTTKPWPLAVGLALEVVANASWLFAPPESISWLLAAMFFYAVGNSIISPCLQARMANEIPNEERANMSSFIFFLMLLLQTPTGILGGYAAHAGARIPFLLVLSFYALALVLLSVYVAYTRKMKLA